MRKILRSFLLALVCVGTLCSIYYVVQLYQNNKTAVMPSQQQLEVALDRSISWAIDNKETLLKKNNVFLWMFLYEASLVAEDERLTQLVAEYQTRNKEKMSVWRLYYEPSAPFYVDEGDTAQMADYQKHLLYGVSCSETLKALEVIRRQMEPDFCRWNPIYSSCTTHQLMGVQFMERRFCGDGNENNALIADLQQQITRQLFLDPRVGDVYVQRAMMLESTGAHDAIRPMWVQRILEAQGADGGWESFYPVRAGSGGSRFGFTYKGLGFRSYDPSFHMTPQGIYLLAMLANRG